MARKRERIFALVGAVLFLGTSLGLSFEVLWQMHENNNSSSASSSSSNSSNTSASSDNSDDESSTQTLEGTLLQNFTPIAHIDKLQEIDTTVGTGATVKAGDTVTVDYTGAVASTGEIFQSSLDSGQPVTFSLSQVIQGWTEGIPGMKVGGTRRLLIPASLAYGANPPSGSGIPANADLVFDVTLHSIGSN